MDGLSGLAPLQDSLSNIDIADQVPSFRNIEELITEPREMKAIRDFYVRNREALGRHNRLGSELRAVMINMVVKGVYELVKLKGANAFYYRRRVDGTYLQYINKEELDAITKRWYLMAFPEYTSAVDLRLACNTVMDNIQNSIPEVSSDYILVTPYLIYDAVRCRLVSVKEMRDKESGLPLIFRRLFDSTITSGDQVKVEPLTETETGYLLQEYNAVMVELKHRKHIMHIEEIRDWACGNPDVYMDIMHMYSTAFMRNKPLGVFFPVGVGRNGKSSCNDLWASLVGTNNTARVPVGKLGERHYVMALQRAMINIPDETNEEVVKDQAAFRIVGAHGELQTERMGSNEPITLRCNFAMSCPVNHVPKWYGDSAEACVKRTMPIPFNASFDSSDLSGRSWGQEHFTKKFMITLAAHVLAYASYYSKNDWQETATMILERQGIEEDSASQYTYARLWSQVFYGFENFETLKKDYQQWCKIRGIEPEEIKKSDVYWRRFRRSRAKTPMTGETITVYVNGRDKNRLIMFDNIRGRHELMNGLRLGKYVEFGSIIQTLEEKGYIETEATKKVKKIQDWAY